MEQYSIGLNYRDSGHGAPPMLVIYRDGDESNDAIAIEQYFQTRHRTVVAILGPAPSSSNKTTIAAHNGAVAGIRQLCRDLGLYRPVIVGLGSCADLALAVAGERPEMAAAVVTLAAAGAVVRPSKFQSRDLTPRLQDCEGEVNRSNADRPGGPAISGRGRTRLLCISTYGVGDRPPPAGSGMRDQQSRIVTETTGMELARLIHRRLRIALSSTNQCTERTTAQDHAPWPAEAAIQHRGCTDNDGSVGKGKAS